MRYIKLDPSYLIENKDDIIQLDKTAFFNGEQLPTFTRKDVVILIGQDFESLSENREEVESGAKNLLNNFHKLFIADTDLNALKYIQDRGVHLLSDYLPLIRAFEIDEMKNLLSNNNPVDFLDDDHRKKDKILRLVLMFVNFQTRKRKIIDVIFSETRENFDEFLNKCEEDNYNLLISLTPDNVEFFDSEINSMLEVSGQIDFNNIAYNKRNDFSPEKISVDSLTEREYGDIFNPTEIFKQDLNTVKKRRSERGDNYYFTLLEFLKNKLLSDISSYSIILQDALFENNTNAIDYYTAGRLSVEKLLNIEQLIEQRENAMLDLINNANSFLDEIDSLLEENKSNQV